MILQKLKIYIIIKTHKKTQPENASKKDYFVFPVFGFCPFFIFNSNLLMHAALYRLNAMISYNIDLKEFNSTLSIYWK